jgi:general stress protein 26
MKQPLEVIAPRFVEMAHGIGMCVAATVDGRGRVHTRVVQPVWTWDGDAVTGWMSSDSTSPKVRDLLTTPVLSVTYWNPDQDTCTADCDVDLIDDLDVKTDAWTRFLSTPPPAGFDPAIHPDWQSASSPTFGVIRLRPAWLRVVPGTLMTAGVGEVWTWRAG